MISKAVIEAANDNNNQATDNTGANATVITEELQSYIKTTIVPNITAEIQINQGAIDDLKKSLADLSEKYKGNQKEYDALIDSISSKLGKLDKNGATNDDVANLKKTLKNYQRFWAIISPLQAQMSRTSRRNWRQLKKIFSQRSINTRKYRTSSLRRSRII